MSEDRRTITLSGGSRGLGLEIARDLLAAGHRVATCSREPSPDIEELMHQHGDGQLLWRSATLGDERSEEQFHEAARAWAGKGETFALINNAAIAGHGILLTYPNVDAQRIIEVNLLGAYRLSRLFLRDRLGGSDGGDGGRGGRIINISSIAGSRGFRGLAAYSATKAGLDGLTRSLSREVAPRGVTVNSIAPGYLETELSAGLSESRKQQVISRTPMNRLGTSADVVPFVRFLLSDGLAFMTGQTLIVDGGLTA